MAGWGLAEGLEQGVAAFLQGREAKRQRIRDDQDRKRAWFLQNSQWLSQYPVDTQKQILGAVGDIFDPDFIGKATMASAGRTGASTIAKGPGAGALSFTDSSSGAGGAGALGIPSAAPGFALKTTADIANDLSIERSRKELEQFDSANRERPANEAWSRARELRDPGIWNDFVKGGGYVPPYLGPNAGASLQAMLDTEDKDKLIPILQAGMSKATGSNLASVQDRTMAMLTAMNPRAREILGIGNPHMEGPPAMLLNPTPPNPADNPMNGMFANSSDALWPIAPAKAAPSQAELFFPQYKEAPVEPAKMVDPMRRSALFQAPPTSPDEDLAKLGTYLQTMGAVDALTKNGVGYDTLYPAVGQIWKAGQAEGYIPSGKEMPASFLKTSPMTPQQVNDMRLAGLNYQLKVDEQARNDAYKQQDLGIKQSQLGISQGNLDLRGREVAIQEKKAAASGADPNKRIFSLGKDIGNTLFNFGYNTNVSAVEASNNFNAMRRKGWIVQNPVTKQWEPSVKRDPQTHRVVSDFTGKVQNEISVMNGKYKKQDSGRGKAPASSDGTAQVMGYNVVGIGSSAPVHYGTHADGREFDVTAGEAKRKGKSLEQAAKEFADAGYVVAIRRRGQSGITSDHLHITEPGSPEAKRTAKQSGVIEPASNAPDAAQVERDIRDILAKHPGATNAQLAAAMGASYSLSPGAFKGAIGRVRKAGKNA